jgi:hypothetical protein
MKFDDQGWLDEAKEIDYLQKSMDRQGHKITHICLHGTAGGTKAENIANYFKTSEVQSSAHFIIGQDGTIVQGVPCSLAAWGNGILLSPRLPWPSNVNPNYYTISIEHCKPSPDNSDSLTDAQKKASFVLIKCICEQYNIPKRKGDVSGGIVEHADFDSVNRARCPGIYPYAELWAYLKGESPVGVPPGWKDDGTKLLAPNGFYVVRGFRDWILNHTWDPKNMPEELEYPPIPGVTWQTFTYSALQWTAKNGVTPAPVGQHYVQAQAKIQKALSDLQ